MLRSSNPNDEERAPSAACKFSSIFHHNLANRQRPERTLPVAPQLASQMVLSIRVSVVIIVVHVHHRETIHGRALRGRGRRLGWGAAATRRPSTLTPSALILSSSSSQLRGCCPAAQRRTTLTDAIESRRHIKAAESTTSRKLELRHVGSLAKQHVLVEPCYSTHQSIRLKLVLHLLVLAGKTELGLHNALMGLVIQVDLGTSTQASEVEARLRITGTYNLSRPNTSDEKVLKPARIQMWAHSRELLLEQAKYETQGQACPVCVRACVCVCVCVCVCARV